MTIRRSSAAAIAAFIVAALATPASAAPITSQAAVALVKATSQLKIDTSVPPSEGFNAKTQPFVNVAHAPEGTVGGYLSVEYAHRGTLHDGTVVLAIPLDSGGSGGVFTQILFAGKSANELRYAGYLNSGGHLDVTVANGTIVARFPDYGPNDPNCCPSKFFIDTYDVAGGKLHKLSEKTVPAKP